MDLENTAIAHGIIAPPPGKSDLQQFDEAAFHRWYSFILGFSDQLVAPLLDKLGVGPDHLVLDPFCGTGTTLIECAKRRIPSIGIDANPFAVFAARVKSEFDLDPDALIRAMRRVEDRYRSVVSTNRRFTAEPTYAYLEKSGMLSRGWISKRPLRKALVLRDAIRRGRDRALTDVMMLALVADLPSNIGNMRFGPQIYRGPIKDDVDPLPLFRARISAIVDDLRTYASGEEKYTDPQVLLGDARSIKPTLRHSYGSNIPAIDFVICSPPYPTEHDYTRHTRLELAFTENISTLHCLRQIKRTMIRSHTKGIYKGDQDAERAKRLQSVEAAAAVIEKGIKESASGFEKLYPTVVRSYFGGMKRHFGSLFRLMRSGGKAAYVVGDQAAYFRTPIRTAALLGETAASVGFKVDGVERWRRRWSTGMKDYLDENILLLSKP